MNKRMFGQLNIDDTDTVLNAEWSGMILRELRCLAQSLHSAIEHSLAAAVMLMAVCFSLVFAISSFAADAPNGSISLTSGSNAAGNAATAGAGNGAGTENGSGTDTGDDSSAQAKTETEPTEHVTWTSCVISGSNIVIKGRQDGSITPSDTEVGKDTEFYLLELAPYEDSIANHRNIAHVQKADDVEFTIPLNSDTAAGGCRLYNRFLACVWTGKTYKVVSDTIYVTNPEAVAANKDAFKNPLTKKGLLIELNSVTDAFNLGVHNVIVNIPFDSLIGEGLTYEYEGETYHFDKNVVAEYDRTISTFSNKSMNVTAILLNRRSSKSGELIASDAKNVSGINYFNFNAGSEGGYKLIRAMASFLASRYNGRDNTHGLVQNWIIGNEINNQSWNYVGESSVKAYAAEYERAFRVFYTAIKAQQANARVYFSLDNNWNQGNDNKLKYTAKATLDAVASVISSHGNIDWNLAYHPYPVPMTEPEFWDDTETGQITDSVSTRVINFANLSVLTDYMQNASMLDRSGRVRHIILSEQGFTSQSATRGKVEKEQAAAFAYAYYLVDSNPYIDAFILSRQIDAPSEVRSSLAFGLWTTDAETDNNIRPYSPKYIWDVFKHIDDKNTTLRYSAFAKEIIGISKWSDVIPNFRWKKYE